MTQRDAPLKLGLIGCGWVAETLHLPTLQEVPDVEVVAVADSDPARLMRVADRFRIKRRYANYVALLEDPAIEAVAVWVPPEFQMEVALAALVSGKHLFIEKPLVLNMDECDRLIEQAGRSGKNLMVGFPRRWNRLVRSARDMIQQGTLGSVHLTRTVLTGGIREKLTLPGWSSRHVVAGILFEFGVHHFDLWRFLLQSEVEEVYAARGSDDATAVVMARMANHVLVSSTFSEKTSGNDEIDIYGHAGRLQLSCYRFDGLQCFAPASLPGDMQTRLRQAVHTLRELPGGLLRMRKGGDFLASYRAEWQHFADSIRLNRQPECTMEDGRRAVQVVLSAMESAVLGRPVKVAQVSSVAADRLEVCGPHLGDMK